MCQILQDIADELKRNPPQDKNGGYNNLMQDLSELLQEAKNYQFDDFRNDKYAAPKVELRNQLLKLAQNVVEGRYDN